jgi:formylglycine-generating enzyme required for sulfatase activity
MDRDKTGAYKEIYTLYCPICRKPKDEVIEALQDIRKKIVQVILLFSLFVGLIVPAIAGSVGTTDPDTNFLGMKFVYIAPGTFTMGSPTDEQGRYISETQHQVTLTQGYYIQSTEVTQGQWEAVMGSNLSHFGSCGSDCPVEKVSWDDAQEFINKLNLIGEGMYMLPTEAQWEYAARARSSSAFANGKITETGSGYDPNLDVMAWYSYNSDSKTHQVAQKTPNAFGLYDMHGNVYEWCQDWYASYNLGPVTDPEGPPSGSYRVKRGGGWYYYARTCRSAHRLSTGPSFRSRHIGLRLVRQAD